MRRSFGLIHRSIMSASDSLVLVTGASGFIASHVTKQLQEQGHRVRVTVRNANNEKKVNPIRQFCPDAKHPLDIVEADLLDAESWPKAVEGCTYVLHIASPFLTAPKTAMEVIRPAVDGTLNVLKACAGTKTVKRVVLTSSIAAVGALHVKENNFFSEDDFLTEEDVHKDSYYTRSKILAERAAWKFVEDLPEGEKFELAVVNPALVMGPVLHGAVGTSMNLMKQMLEKSMPALAAISMMLGDVRDVAAAHIKCMTLPEAAGKRHIIGTEPLWVQEMALILEKEFKPQGLTVNEFVSKLGYDIPTKVLPKPIASVAKHFISTLKIGLREGGERMDYDTTRMRKVLQITPTPVDKSLIDMAYSMIELGFVKKTAKYRGPNAATAN